MKDLETFKPVENSDYIIIVKILRKMREQYHLSWQEISFGIGHYKSRNRLYEIRKGVRVPKNKIILYNLRIKLEGFFSELEIKKGDGDNDGRTNNKANC